MALMPGESPAASPGLGPAFDLCPETEERGVSDQAGPRPPAPAGRGVGQEPECSGRRGGVL